MVSLSGILLGMDTTTKCSVDGCERSMEARGWCATHYMRWRKHGDPTTVLPRGPGRPKLATECSIDGCERLGPYFRSWCKLHYGRWHVHGDPLWEPIPAIKPPCSVEGCERISHVRGWCVMHYSRWREHGDPGEATPRRGAAGTGCIDALGYHSIKIGEKRKKSHRLVMEEMIGRPLLPEETVHHVNGIRTDNRPENLELWTGPHGKGQRKEDLIAFVVEHYRDDVIAELGRT